ncbi:MAG: serine/threonine-protein kinase [Pirellulales bacterium]
MPRVAHFDILESLGVGAVGSVYRARDTESGTFVALKLLHDNPKDMIDVQRRFIREVAVLQQLDHPNIVRYHDCGIYEGRFYLAMEHVDCGTLKDVLHGKRSLAWRDAVDVAIQICAALEGAHAGGVIHRDLKPANLFLSGKGLVKVGDFGLARAENLSRLTDSGTTVGTCRYMPPEQITGEEVLTGAVDLYALGCVMFEMLVGRAPFDGTSLVMVFEKHMFAEPENPADLIVGCPADLGKVILRLLAKEPSGRPSSAGVVKKWLEQIAAGEPVDWETAARAKPIPPVPAMQLPTSVDGPTQNLTERLYGRLELEQTGPDWKLILLGLVLLLIAIAAAIWFKQ